MCGLQILYFVSYLLQSTSFTSYVIFQVFVLFTISCSHLQFQHWFILFPFQFTSSMYGLQIFLFHFTPNVNLQVLYHFSNFLFSLQFIVPIYNSNIDLRHFLSIYYPYVWLKNSFFVSLLMSIYKLYVIFLSFCFVYNLLFQFTTPTLIYSFFFQFTSHMCVHNFCFHFTLNINL